MLECATFNLRADPKEVEATRAISSHQNRLLKSFTKATISIPENSLKDDKNFFPGFKYNRPIIKYVIIMRYVSLIVYSLSPLRFLFLKYSTLIKIPRR